MTFQASFIFTEQNYLFIARQIISSEQCCIVTLRTSCEKEEQYWVTDYIPFTINITVSDKNGTDLLNPNDEGTIYNEGIKAFTKGKNKEGKRTRQKLGPRVIWVHFTG